MMLLMPRINVFAFAGLLRGFPARTVCPPIIFWSKPTLIVIQFGLHNGLPCGQASLFGGTCWAGGCELRSVGSLARMELQLREDALG